MNPKLETLLGKLPSAKEVGDRQWEALCPAHDDSRPSLRIACPSGRAILVCCQKGCATRDVLKAVGMTMEDISSRGESGDNGREAKKKIVATFDYKDENSELIFQVVRYDPKSFSQRRPAGKGKWTWDKKGCRVIPYRLPELIAADASQVVFVPEGEKHCDALAALGLVATCNAGGAEKWTKDHATFLKARTVIILPDNDAKGRGHAAIVAKSLGGVAAPVKVLALPELPEKGDVLDWLAAGGTKEQLLSLAGDAPLASEVADVGESETPPVEPVRVITSAEFIAGDYERRYIIDGLLVASEPAGMGAIYKCFKTTLAIDLALSVGSGAEFLGRFTTHKQRVALLSFESGKATIKETVLRIAAARGIDPKAADVLWGFEHVCLGSATGLDSLAAMIGDNEVKVVIVDPLYLSLLGAETKGLSPANLFDIGPLLLDITAVCLDSGATPILLHHARKNSPNDKFAPPELSDLSGAGFAEFFRQWILLGRREDYRNDGHHKLWFSYGGSAGHGGLWALDIDEGRIDDPGGRKWELSLSTPHEADAEKKNAAELKRAAEKQERDRQHRERLLGVIADFPDGETANVLREKASLSGDKFKLLAESLEADGLITRCKVAKSNRNLDGWKPAKTTPGQPGQNGHLSDCPTLADEAEKQSDGRGVSTIPPSSPTPPPQSASPSTTHGPGQKELSASDCSHVWHAVPDRHGRAGWLTTVCRVCGVIQGSAPAGAANGRAAL